MKDNRHNLIRSLKRISSAVVVVFSILMINQIQSTFSASNFSDSETSVGNKFTAGIWSEPEQAEQEEVPLVTITGLVAIENDGSETGAIGNEVTAQNVPTGEPVPAGSEQTAGTDETGASEDGGQTLPTTVQEPGGAEESADDSTDELVADESQATTDDEADSGSEEQH